MLFRDTTGDPEIQAFHRELQASARNVNIALLRDDPELDVPAEELEPLAEAVRSATTGLAIWWVDHPDVERGVLVAGVERVALGVQAVAGVLDEGHGVGGQERDVVEAAVLLVALVEERERAGVGRGAGLHELLDVAPPAGVVVLGAVGVGVAG